MLLEKPVALDRKTNERNLAKRFATKAEELPETTEQFRNPSIGKIQDSTNLDSTTATTVAILANVGNRNGQEIADEFGICRDSVNRLKNEGSEKVDQEAVQRTIGKVHDLALDRLMNSIGFITTDKLHELGAKDLSSIASNMSKVHQNMRDNNQKDGPMVHIQIYAPDAKQEKSFKTLDV